jgi:hypothetical protein
LFPVLPLSLRWKVKPVDNFVGHIDKFKADTLRSAVTRIAPCISVLALALGVYQFPRRPIR